MPLVDRRVRGEAAVLEAIEGELGISRERVRRLKQRALDELGAKLRGVVDAARGELAEAA